VCAVDEAGWFAPLPCMELVAVVVHDAAHTVPGKLLASRHPRFCVWVVCTSIALGACVHA
jgi:hypothetical protein